MKTEEFTRKDGTKGTTNIPEAEDVFTSNYDTVRVSTAGQYENYSLGVRNDKNEELFIKITKGQKKSLEKGTPLKGKRIEFYSYENDYGKQVGAKAV